MSDKLSEEEMRQALFGSGVLPAPDQSASQTHKLSVATKAPVSKRLSSRLRLTLYVTRIFEGQEEVFVHDADTLSTLVAEA